VSARGLRALLVVLALATLGLDRPKGLDDVTEVRHWSYPDYTRVVVELSGGVRMKSEPRLLAPAAGLPERLYVDLEGVWVGRRFDAGVPVGDGLLQGVRIGQNTRRAIRVVLDLETYAHHRVLTLRHPDRLVIDVYGVRGRGPRRDGDARRLPSGLRALQTVVLDPGHGGRDPGAIGVGGLREKDVTLRMAKVLRRKLEALGFRVVLTREDDRALGLEERTAIAEAAPGDLFVSLHANASRRRSAHGIETYYLDANHERHSLTVAARENGVSRTEVNDLQRTIAKLRVSEVSPHSKRLAEQVQNELIRGLPRRYRPVADLGAKKGPFYVLFLSSMPAVLVETGFVTHQREAQRLRDAGYVDAVAERIATALVEYRDSGQSFATRVGR
jgi:N-acetylmuramoyl-L-alanine amidase